MPLAFAGMTDQGFKGQKGDRGESFQVDKFGELDDVQAQSIESDPSIDENDVYVFVVTSDTRTLKPLDGVFHPDSSEPDDPTDTEKKVDTSRHVLMYNGRKWHNFWPVHGYERRTRCGRRRDTGIACQAGEPRVHTGSQSLLSARLDYLQ